MEAKEIVDSDNRGARIQQTCAEFVEQVRRAVPVDSLAVVLLDPGQETSQVAYSWRDHAKYRDFDADRSRTVWHAAPTPAALTIPLRGCQGVFGAAFFQRADPQPYAPEERQLAHLLARRLAFSLESLVRWEPGADPGGTDPLVEEAARVLISALDMDHAYDRFAQGLRKLMDFDWAALNIIDQESGLFSIKHLTGGGVPVQLVGSVRPLAGSQTKQVVDTQQPLVRGNLASDLRFASDPVHLGSGLRSAIMVPLLFDGRVIGVLSLRSRQPDAFGPAQLELLEKLARRIAPVVEDSLSLQKIRVSLKEMALVKEVAPVLASSLDIEQVFEQVARAANKVVKFHRAALSWIDANGYDIHQLETAPEWPLLRESPTTSADSAISAWLTYQQEVVGYLTLTRRDRVFYPADQELLNRLGAQVAPAVQNTRMYRQTEYQTQRWQNQPDPAEGRPAPQAGNRPATLLPLAELTHRIRTPLTTIKGYSSTLLQRDLTWSAEDRRKFLEIIDREADRLNEMIGGLLGLTGDSFAGDLPEPREMTVAELLAAVREEVSRETRWYLARVGPAAEAPPVVVVDPVGVGKAVKLLLQCLGSRESASAPAVVEVQTSNGSSVLRVGPGTEGIRDSEGVATPPEDAELRFLVARRLLAA